MNNIFLRPQIATFVLWPVLFLVMPSIYYSNSICRMGGDVTHCGWQITLLLSGVISLVSLQSHLRFLGVWPYQQSALVQVILAIGMNIGLAYLYSAMIVYFIRSQRQHE